MRIKGFLPLLALLSCHISAVPAPPKLRTRARCSLGPGLPRLQNPRLMLTCSSDFRISNLPLAWKTGLKDIAVLVMIARGASSHLLAAGEVYKPSVLYSCARLSHCAVLASLKRSTMALMLFGAGTAALQKLATPLHVFPAVGTLIYFFPTNVFGRKKTPSSLVMSHPSLRAEFAI